MEKSKGGGEEHGGSEMQEEALSDALVPAEYWQVLSLDTCLTVYSDADQCSTGQLPRWSGVLV